MTHEIQWEEAVAQVTAPGSLFELKDETIRGETYRVFAQAPSSLRSIFDTARGRGDETFLVFEDETWSFSEVMAQVDAMAAMMVDRFEIGPGDRVAIGMRNYPEWIMAFAAATSVGAIAVCMNAWWTARELEYGLKDSGAKLFFGDIERIKRAEGCLPKLGVAAVCVRSEAEVPGGVFHLEDVITPGAPMPEVVIESDDDATILYTSGTTGFPKGAVSTHRAITNALSAFACGATVNRLIEPPQKTHPWPMSFILTVPLFHVTGLIPVMLSSFAGGFKLVMMYKWNPERALQLIEKERVTMFVGVPTMSWDLMESPDFADRDTSSLLNVGGGGAPAPPELVRRVDKGFRSGRPGLGYGMTETNAYGPQNSGANYVRKPRSAGRAVPILQVKVGDGLGQELPRGDAGEIFFRGVTLIRGYWNKPEATAETFVDGWLRSGDIGRLDEEGFIFVEDRVKDMILRAGENIYCAEVEAAIYQHPAIHEAAVFGLPHERLGEEVAVAVCLKSGQELGQEELRSFLSERIAAFKVPGVVVFHEEALPRNAAGKILKKTLRDVTAKGSKRV